ncbi:hypothetical protein WL76_30185 [Burkholderia ubonensis]|uniref:hypothetical protein n=1 Tax=Burkholderia ubonensis TaxID=101571 RepID=UPI000756FF55|nr:hypothetical protein [Burkholderia ubonensis]KVT89047.1 hypothetical protein WK59_06940 [Burkholderia ubonensis]KWE44773.1 hypothetical protein WL76_30185 [Burkholderia ubonensis]
MTLRLQRIGDQHRRDHYHLTAEDECYFFGELTRGQDYTSPTKSLISNLKKKRGAAGYQYKAPAIQQAAGMFRSAISATAWSTLTFVPIPPSRCHGDPGYDDRMVRVLQQMAQGVGADVRELVLQTANYQASHESGNDRIKLDELIALYRINENCAAPTPSSIMIVDDVLTSGCHYRATKAVLLERFPGVAIWGLFIARRALPSAADVFSDL